MNALSRVAWPHAIPAVPGPDEAAAHARAKRLAAEAAPPAHAHPMQWDDPEDSVQTRHPKQVRGFKRGDPLGRLHARGIDVSKDHLIAANMLRCAWDAARLGYTGGNPLSEYVSGSPGPAFGPSAGAVERAVQEREVQRVLRFVGPTVTPLLLYVVIGNNDVAAWCAAEAKRTGQVRPCAKKELGRLRGVLDRLVEYFGVDAARDRAKGARRELGRS